MKDQVVLITGASRGVGQATAVALAGCGARIIAVGRTREGLDETQSIIEKAGGSCQTLIADVSRAAEVRRMVDSAVREFRRIDVLVNNAGKAPLALMQDYDWQAFDDMMAVNCHAVFYACRAVWPVMIAQGGGQIVNISSVAAVDPFRGFAPYGASKRFVNALTEGLDAEGREHNIRIYAVAPGAVDTTMLRRHFPDFPESQCLDPQDVARTIVWILGDPAGYASGAVVQIRK